MTNSAKIRGTGIALGMVVIGAIGCSKPTPPAPLAPQYNVRNVPGVYESIWEEPMVDVVDVPPGLDPEGHYYRPGHQEVVEIRQGRWQYYRRPQQ